tara:strand:+ start:384 stop:791 length:408 start_codon:yes stop_codon:yes gene_type:complete
MINLIILPNDVINIIFSYLSIRNKIFLNNTYYKLYNKYIYNYIKNYQSYIRDIIRNDYSYVFNYIIEKDINNWLTDNRFIYYNNIYNKYIDFILSYARKNNANKCLYLLNLKLNISKLKKLNCKDTRIINKKWIK